MNFWALTRKELFSAAHSPAFYGIGLFFLLFLSVSFFYFQNFFIQNMASLRPFFAAFPPVFILVIPLFTMKSWAEERKTGTDELLLSMPFSEWDLVLGKFLAALILMAALVALTLPVPLSVLPLGHFDPGVIIAEYAGTILLAASATALGILFSALSKSQAGAFLGSSAVLLSMLLIDQFIPALGWSGIMAEGLSFFSLSSHFESFSRGLIDSRDLAFFLLSTGLFLFLTTRTLTRRKWD